MVYGMISVMLTGDPGVKITVNPFQGRGIDRPEPFWYWVPGRSDDCVDWGEFLRRELLDA